MGAAGMSVNCPRFKLPSPNRRTGRPVWRAAIVVGVLDPRKSAPGARERAFGVPIGGVDVRQFGGRISCYLVDYFKKSDGIVWFIL